LKTGLDPQESALRKGIAPDEDGFGVEKSNDWGWISTIENGENHKIQVETLPGRYMGFYDDVYECIVTGKEAFVTAKQAAYNIKVIEAARKSAEMMEVVRL
jgi:scyllo-inositol 2-dehydrogenase (NADP+)